MDGELKRNVKITFQDSPENDYYVLRLFAHSWEVEFIDTIYEQQPVYFSSQNAAIENKNDNGFYSSTNFTDALFNGEEKNIRIDIINEGYGYEDCDTIRLQFSVFSSDTYNYYNSLGNHREKGPVGIFGGEVIKPFAFAMIIGVLIGTYSSIYVATPILKYFNVSYKSISKDSKN